MTVSQAIIKWLQTFAPQDDQKMRWIDTDLMHGNVDYALVKEPVTNVTRYITGTEVHKDYYQIRARLDSQTNADCVENGAWLEALTEWIGEKDRLKDFPELEGATVKKISVSSPFYMGRNEQNKSIYQMTICIEYFKGGE